MRILYILSGLGFLVASFLFFTWFRSDIIYLFTSYGFHYSTYWIRFLSSIATLLFGLFYLYYGIKKSKINRFSNLSLLILVVSLLIYWVLILISMIGCPFGGCTSYGLIAEKIYQLPIVIGTLLSIVLVGLSFSKK